MKLNKKHNKTITNQALTVNNRFERINCIFMLPGLTGEQSFLNLRSRSLNTKMSELIPKIITESSEYAKKL